MAETRSAKKRKTVFDVTEKDRQGGKKQKTGAEPSNEDQGKITPRIMVQSCGYYILERKKPTEDLMNTMVKATKSGYDILRSNGSAVDAVEKTISLLEDDPYFNAGYGSVLNEDGEVECDAMIMDGDTLNTGAVMGAQHFRNPVSISRKIMEESPHCALNGKGALKFAESINFPTCEPNELISDEAYDYRLEKTISNKQEPFINFGERYYSGKTSDTVTAVALDNFGHFACAASTGGIPGKAKGRIGDAPLVGCGGYANEYGAAATSGYGEALIKMTLAREVVYNMERGQNAQESTTNAVEKLENRVTNGYGSATAIDRNGNFGKATNAPLVLWAQMVDGTVEFGNERKKKFDYNKE